ncbi:DNA-nicking endonuclease, Smr domain [Pseudomonas citronellolis]|uniref:DNA-nicking endonuclease, Smr domain n=1 Tax=Pseudomonas citronellolis TaxID=53408 RepID=A0AAQ1KLT5_9PSED|nr:Smr/MutS family protein [Pseudomonas citronellolis]MCP1645785.1 DNA-nicking Smr family endonuclease [Pseudomonas citronellolis]MCP1668619.1 DNA-nicking Smr family endonuclease [Pseudomonas citronellolis]MCP1700057.1 DNA-nicking Smr family endonuclease [Pseudomonas citronellolis]MCP1706495.1 DNA-nicking Smr family endonuclease [Pseudomonas citronellolis]MCP1800285.1 DNA-nicking Smr family endonuclease [Pseudomonas citronellolis]
MQDDDFSLFANEMRGVKRIQVDQADTGKPKADRQQVKLRQQNAATKVENQRVDGLSDLFVIDVGAEDELYWARDGVQEGQMRKLKAGQIGFEGSLDLHGMNIEKARELLWDFLAEATRLEVRCVRVTHGKAARTDGRRPLLKSHVNTWLRQHPQVLGFTSALPRHGGTGSLYVMLRRTMLEGRDE